MTLKYIRQSLHCCYHLLGHIRRNVFSCGCVSPGYDFKLYSADLTLLLSFVGTYPQELYFLVDMLVLGKTLNYILSFSFLLSAVDRLSVRKGIRLIKNKTLQQNPSPPGIRQSLHCCYHLLGHIRRIVFS